MTPVEDSSGPVGPPASGAHWSHCNPCFSTVEDATLRDRTTSLVNRMATGDAAAADRLLPILYGELRQIARRMLADQRRSTLSPTELIHEAWVRLVDEDGAGPEFEGRRHFRRVAARAMRFVLVDRARARLSDKRGGDRRQVTLDAERVGDASEAWQVLQVHDAIAALGQRDEELAQLVELRFFGGMKMEEVADVMGVSRSSVQRSWRLVRAWWRKEFAGPTEDDG